MLRGYLILIRFDAVIVISILASHFLEHTVYLTSMSLDATPSTRTPSPFTDFYTYDLELRSLTLKTFFGNAYSHDEYLWQLLLKFLH